MFIFNWYINKCKLGIHDWSKQTIPYGAYNTYSMSQLPIQVCKNCPKYRKPKSKSGDN